MNIQSFTAMNNHKRKLLREESDYPQVNEEWIMLQDMNPSKQTKNAVVNPPKYYQLQDHPQPHRLHNQIPQMPKQAPFNPKIITMNGQTFKEVEKERREPEVRPKKSKLPQMQVSCYYCSCVQSVPGTAEEFKCCNCSKHNQCLPIYRIFRCGTCSAKVCYAASTSDMIRCTKCGTVNKVPQATYNKSAQIKIPSSNREQNYTEVQEYASLQERSELGEEFELQSLSNRRL